MKKQTIQMYELDSFLRLELGYILAFPLAGRYVHPAGGSEIILPDQESFTDDEIVGKILRASAYERLLEYIRE